MEKRERDKTRASAPDKAGRRKVRPYTLVGESALSSLAAAQPPHISEKNVLVRYKPWAGVADLRALFLSFFFLEIKESREGCRGTRREGFFAEKERLGGNLRVAHGLLLVVGVVVVVQRKKGLSGR